MCMCITAPIENTFCQTDIMEVEKLPRRLSLVLKVCKRIRHELPCQLCERVQDVLRKIPRQEPRLVRRSVLACRIAKQVPCTRGFYDRLEMPECVESQWSIIVRHFLKVMSCFKIHRLKFGTKIWDNLPFQVEILVPL